MSGTGRLVADVGGTNTRIALFEEDSGSFRALSTFLNGDYDGLEAVLEDWLQALPGAPPQDACIAVAAPIAGDRVEMVNRQWSFSASALARRLGLRRLRLINDFEANAWALPFLQPGDLEPLHPGDSGQAGVLAALGPGTGLGGATAERRGGEVLVRPCEPGHAGLSPADELELELFRRLLPRWGNIYAELLVSGPGLQRLFETLAEVEGLGPRTLSPAEISRLALSGEDPLCRRALDLFCGLLGSAAGDFVLASGAYGGLFLAGGILPRMVPFLRDSAFHRRFVSKGAMSGHLAKIPVSVITTPQPGLIGAARAALR